MSKADGPDLSDALVAAKSLLGWQLIHKTAEGTAAGYIVETEAYTMEDAASHTYGGERPRNSSMFRTAGTVYVYFTYGMHYCVNIVTGSEGHGQGVLIRALEPTLGLDLMKMRRGIQDEQNLTNGPAKLVQALGITKLHNGTDIYGGLLRLEQGFTPAKIVQTTRVGISKAVDVPWRFYVAGSAYVSRK